MNGPRLVILWVALIFVAGFAFLTVRAAVRDGFDLILTPLSLLVLAMLGIGIVGALRRPPE